MPARSINRPHRLAQASMAHLKIIAQSPVAVLKQSTVVIDRRTSVAGGKSMNSNAAS
jgi:hypothetical protein